MRALWSALVILFATGNPALCSLPAYEAFYEFHVGEYALRTVEPIFVGSGVRNFADYDRSFGQNPETDHRFDMLRSEDNRLIIWNRDFYLYPWPIGGNQSLAVDFVGLFCGSSMRVRGLCPGLSGGNRITSFGGGTVGYTNAFLKEEALQQSYGNKPSGRVDQPFREIGEISRINRELAIIFGNLPFGVYVTFGFIGGGIIWCSFIILESRRLVIGSFALALGLIILLSNGFAVVGSGPLGWVTWVAGD